MSALSPDELAQLVQIMRRTELTAVARFTLVFLRLAYGTRAELSKQTLGLELGLDPRTLRSAYAILRGAGLLHDVDGKAGQTQALQIELRLVQGGSAPVFRADPPPRGSAQVLPFRADPPPPGSEGGRIHVDVDPTGGADPRAPGSARIEEELNSRSSFLVPALEEEERNSLRAQKQEDPESVLLDLAVDEDLAAFWPGSTAEQRLEALLQGTEAKRRDGRPFVQVDAGSRVLRLQAAGHLKYYARTALRHQAADSGPRSASPARRPSSPPAPAKDALPDVDPDEFLNNETGVPDLLGMYNAQKAKAQAKGGAR